MSDEEVTCEMCGTALMDLERRLERNDSSHRHHPSDCARILKLKLVEMTRMMHEGVDADIRFGCDILLALGHTEAANHDQIVGLVRAQREAMTDLLARQPRRSDMSEGSINHPLTPHLSAEEYVALPVCACGWRSSILTICPTCKKPMTVVPVESMRSENEEV